MAVHERDKNRFGIWKKTVNPR